MRYKDVGVSEGKKIAKAEKIALFYRPGCPWCDMFEPEWKIIEKALGTKAGKVNTADPNGSILSKQYGVNGVPTIILFDKDKNQEVYTGTRTAEAILARFN